MKKIILSLAIAIASLATTQQAVAQSESKITCVSGNQLKMDKVGEYMYYNIDFTNNSNAVVENIDIVNEFDPNKFDISTLEIVSSAIESIYVGPNPAILNVAGNKATYSFRKAGNGGPGGHGTVAVKIKTKANLLPGSPVTNNGTIKMDNNPIIYTNLEQTIFTDAVIGQDNSIQAFPIPADDNLTITCNSVVRSVDLLGDQNQIVETILADEPSKSFDISAKLDGVYYVRVTSDNGQKIIRIVKQ
jgi:hypothetical protein